MPATWETDANGLRYVRCSYAGEDTATMMATMQTIADLALAEPHPIGVLIDGRDFRPTPRYLAFAKSISREVFGPRRTLATMTVADGFVRSLVNGFNNVSGGARIRAVRSEEAGLTWIRTHLPASFDAAA